MKRATACRVVARWPPLGAERRHRRGRRAAGRARRSSRRRFLLPALALALRARAAHGAPVVAALGFVARVPQRVLERLLPSAPTTSCGCSIVAVGGGARRVQRAGARARRRRPRAHGARWPRSAASPTRRRSTARSSGWATRPCPPWPTCAGSTSYEEDGDAAPRVRRAGAQERRRPASSSRCASATATIGELGFAAARAPHATTTARFFGVLAGRVALALGNAAAARRADADARAPRPHPRLARRGGDGPRRAGPHDLRERGGGRAARRARRRRRCRPSPARWPRGSSSRTRTARPVDVEEFPGRRLHGRRARPAAAAHPQRAPRHRPRVLAADEGDAAARRGRRAARGQRHRGRHRRQGGRAAPALPRRGRPGRSRPRSTTSRRCSASRARGAVAGRLVRGRPRRPGGIERVASRTATRQAAARHELHGATRPTPRRDRRAGGPAHRAGRALRRDPRRAARAGRARRGAPAADPRARHARRHGRPDDRRRRGPRRDDVRVGGERADVRRRRLRVRPGPRAPRRDGGPERPPATPSRCGSRRRSSAACCPTSCPTCPAGRPARRTRPATRGPRSAATSTTSSRPAAATSSSSAT